MFTFSVDFLLVLCKVKNEVTLETRAMASEIACITTEKRTINQSSVLVFQLGRHDKAASSIVHDRAVRKGTRRHLGETRGHSRRFRLVRPGEVGWSQSENNGRRQCNSLLEPSRLGEQTGVDAMATAIFCACMRKSGRTGGTSGHEQCTDARKEMGARVGRSRKAAKKCGAAVPARARMLGMSASKLLAISALGESARARSFATSIDMLRRKSQTDRH